MGKKQEAIRAYTNLTKIKGYESEGYAHRGRIFAEIGDVKRAFEDFEEAFMFDPENTSAYIYKANALLEMGNYPQAIDVYTEALGINPEIPEAYLNRGIAYEKMGNLELAQENFKIYMQMNRLTEEPAFL